MKWFKRNRAKRDAGQQWMAVSDGIHALPNSEGGWDVWYRGFWRLDLDAERLTLDDLLEIRSMIDARLDDVE